MKPTLRTLLTLTFAATAVASLQAAPATEAQTTDLGPYVLKSKSTFNLPLERRAPFWPIGWVKRAPELPNAVTQAPRAKLDEKAFNVSSILVGNPSLVVLNGRAYSEGELVRRPKGVPAGKIRVQQIADGSVTLESEGQTLVVTMRRVELAVHKPAELLLEDEER